MVASEDFDDEVTVPEEMLVEPSFEYWCLEPGSNKLLSSAVPKASSQMNESECVLEHMATASLVGTAETKKGSSKLVRPLQEPLLVVECRDGCGVLRGC